MIGNICAFNNDFYDPLFSRPNGFWNRTCATFGFGQRGWLRPDHARSCPVVGSGPTDVPEMKAGRCGRECYQHGNLQTDCCVPGPWGRQRLNAIAKAIGQWQTQGRRWRKRGSGVDGGREGGVVGLPFCTRSVAVN